MSLVLVCPPVIVTDRQGPVVTAKICRVAAISKSNNEKYEVEILDAPPVNIEISSQMQPQPYHS